MPTSQELWPSTSLDRALSIDHQYEDSLKKWQGIPGCGPDYSAHKPAVVHKKAEPIVSGLQARLASQNSKSMDNCTCLASKASMCVDQTRATGKKAHLPKQD